MWKQQRQFKQGIATCQAWCSSWSLWWHLDFQEETCPDMSGSVSLYSNTWLSESLSGTKHTLWNRSMIRWCSLSIPFRHLNWHHWHHVWTSQLSSTGEFHGAMELITGGWPMVTRWAWLTGRLRQNGDFVGMQLHFQTWGTLQHEKAWESMGKLCWQAWNWSTWNILKCWSYTSSIFIIFHHCPFQPRCWSPVLVVGTY